MSFVFVLFGVPAWRRSIQLYSTRYNGGFLPEILLLTQAPILVGFDDTIIVYYYYPLDYVLQGILFSSVWWLCMVINISVQYNGGLLPDIIPLTQGYYHRGTNPFKYHVVALSLHLTSM